MKRIFLIFFGLLVTTSSLFGQWNRDGLDHEDSDVYLGHNDPPEFAIDDRSVSVIVTKGGQLIPENKLSNYSFYVIMYGYDCYRGQCDRYGEDYGFETIGDIIVTGFDNDNNAIYSVVPADNITTRLEGAYDISGTYGGGLMIVYYSDFKIFDWLAVDYIEVIVVDKESGLTQSSGKVSTQDQEIFIDIFDPHSPTGPALAVTDLLESEESSEETPELLDFLVYPNPVEKGNSVLLTLNCPEDSLSGVLIEVYDHTGKCVLKKDAEGREVSIDGLKASGIYFIRVISPDGVSKTKRVQVK